MSDMPRLQLYVRVGDGPITPVETVLDQSELARLKGLRGSRYVPPVANRTSVGPSVLGQPSTQTSSGRQFYAPDAAVRRSMQTRADLHPMRVQDVSLAPPSGMKAVSRQNVPELDTQSHLPPSAITATSAKYTSTQSIQAPDATPKQQKEYCTYWIRNGSCDFVHGGGCRFKHEMPDIKVLRQIGFREVPRWWQEQTALRINPNAKSWLAARAAQEEDKARKVEQEVILNPNSSLISFESDAETATSEEVTRQGRRQNGDERDHRPKSSTAQPALASRPQPTLKPSALAARDRVQGQSSCYKPSTAQATTKQPVELRLQAEIHAEQTRKTTASKIFSALRSQVPGDSEPQPHHGTHKRGFEHGGRAQVLSRTSQQQVIVSSSESSCCSSSDQSDVSSVGSQTSESNTSPSSSDETELVDLRIPALNPSKPKLTTGYKGMQGLRTNSSESFAKRFQTLSVTTPTEPQGLLGLPEAIMRLPREHTGSRPDSTAYGSGNTALPPLKRYFSYDGDRPASAQSAAIEPPRTEKTKVSSQHRPSASGPRQAPTKAPLPSSVARMVPPPTPSGEDDIKGGLKASRWAKPTSAVSCSVPVVAQQPQHSSSNKERKHGDRKRSGRSSSSDGGRRSSMKDAERKARRRRKLEKRVILAKVAAEATALAAEK